MGRQRINWLIRHHGNRTNEDDMNPYPHQPGSPQFDGAEAYEEYCNELERLRATILNIQALAERGFPIDNAKLAERCRKALSQHLP